MKIQCPKCNKIIIISEDAIIPKVGMCPNCGDEVNFTASTEMFPNVQYDKDGNMIWTDETVKERFNNLRNDLNNLLEELQETVKGNK